MIPYGVFLQAAALVLAVLGVNRVLKDGAFAVTYVLYEDRLSVITRYGFIEKETASFPLENSKFSPTRAEGACGSIAFHPDEKLKELLGL